ncbi:MAG: 7TM diverse intracellular signaling domain-containing protein [Bacteroidota bacterium]|nr:7TM diverse intracellular signaling domain-containing protein [Bacteroidota bacterium]MEC8803075.1 7TM diverse intracellular signaling domain-containing protein [Bacteroidota bacterium]
MLRVLPFLLLLAWTGDATSQTRGGQDRYIGEMAVELEGTWDANPTLERLQTAPKRNIADPLINLGNDGQWHWIELTGLSRAFGSQFLEVATAQIDSLTFLSTCNGNLKDGPLHLNGVSIRGTSDGRGQSLTDGTFPMFPLGGADLCEEDKIYLGVKSGKQISLPLRVASLNDLREWSFMRDVFFSFYAGIMLVMLLYNLVLYFTVEDRSYLLYVLFLIGVALSQLFLAGYQGVIPGWDGTSWLGLRAVHFVGIFSGVTTILFVNRFLDLARKGPGYHRVFNGLMSLYCVALVFLLVGRLNWAFQTINFVAMAALLVVPASIHVWRQGQRSALYLLIAFTFFLLTVVMFAVSQFTGNPLPFVPQSVNNVAMPVGSIVEVVLLSLALADRINQFKRESAKAREEQLRVSQLNEKITREQNEVLERNVRERTEELEERNDRLRAALEELKLAQDQLVQSEKLASIGQLTAGIAHELNNPINFVSSSAQSLRRDFDDVTEILRMLTEMGADDDALQEKVQALQDRMTQLDMAFTMKEIDELLTGIDDGATRTSEIVKGLRIFSRMDGDAATEANLNDLLESTLVILRSSLQDEVELTVDLAPNVPAVPCQPGKLNQVFMNLITNAAQATSKTDLAPADRYVRIRTRVLQQEGANAVQVSIEDNGIGMSEAVQSQIFDPFFTTKDVGEGTGLGLSIVKGILDDHQATLDIQSTPGEGSTFLITFPS